MPYITVYYVRISIYIILCKMLSNRWQIGSFFIVHVTYVTACIRMYFLIDIILYVFTYICAYIRTSLVVVNH